MPAPISIIIPTLNVASVISPTLKSLFEGVHAGIVQELIFVDGGSTDDIAKIADEVGAVFINAPLGRGSQLRAGVAQAKAPWVFIVHADTTLSIDWPVIVLDHIQTSDRAGYANLKFDENALMAHVTAAWANLRSRLFALPYGDQTLLISKTHYKSVGGYPDQPLMEDVEIARRIGRNFKVLNFDATTSAIRYNTGGWIKRGWKNLITLALYYLGRDPQKLAERYKR